MKKLLAMLLALIMVCSLATVAFAAEEGDEEVPAAPETSDNVTASSSTTTIVLNKLYTITGAADNTYSTDVNEANAVYPHETLSFVSTPNAGNPTNQNLTIADLEVAYNETSANVSGTMAITLPAYTKVGVYKYTVAETAPTNKAQAATYATESIELQVLVEYNEDHTALVASLYLTDKEAGSNTQVGTQANGKVDTFVNTYKVGHLDVKKTVSGNLTSNKQEFTMTVTFKSEKPVMSDITVYDPSTEITSTIAHGTGWTEKTQTITVKADETVHFYNIPEGVTYTVVEDTKHAAEDPNGTNPETGYTVTGEVKTATAITSNATATVTVNNEKSTSVSTGIVLDSMPYVLILAVAVIGLTVVFSKKRYEA